LLTALVIGLTLTCGGAAYGIFFALREEAAELFDYELQTVANSLPVRNNGGTEGAELPAQNMGGLSDDAIVIQAWDRQGRAIYPVVIGTDLPRLEAGFHQIERESRHWRVFGLDETNGPAQRFVQVAQPIEVRDRLALRLALRSSWPILLWFPVTVILTLLIVRRGLLPLTAVSRALAKRSLMSLQPLGAPHDEVEVPMEIRPMVDALNALFKRLDEASAAQRVFVADAAHELRTPLTALKVEMQRAIAEFADNATRAAPTPQDNATRDVLLALEARLNRIIHVAQQLLSMAREDAIAPAPARAFDLRDVAEQVVADLSVLAEGRGIDLGLIALQDDGSVAVLEGDRHGLAMLLTNLIDNAIRHTDAGGEVDVIVATSIEAPAAAPCVTLTVRDTGPGVPEAELPRIFDRFYRGRTTRAQGSGLGLAIVQHIAARHHATVNAYNRADRAGFVVVVRFPLAPGAMDTAGAR
jgi:two-component system OmpR family sensor kinase